MGGITDFRVLEANPGIGGRIKSGKIGGKTIEFGANWLEGPNSSNWLSRMMSKYQVSCNNTNWSSWQRYDEHGLMAQDLSRAAAKFEETWEQSNLSLEEDVSARTAATFLGLPAW